MSGLTSVSSIVAFQFRKLVKAAHIKDALLYSIGFHCVGRGVKNNKEFSICKTKEVK